MIQPGLDQKTFDKLLANLKAIPGDVRVADISKTLDKAGEMFAAEARTRVAVRTGNLRNSIGIIRKRGGKLVPYTMVGPRYYGGNAGVHGHLVEYGTAERQRHFGNKKLGLRNRSIKAKLLGTASTGSMPANPFMKPAYLAKKQQVIKYLEKEIATLVAEAIKKRGLQFTKAA